MSVSLAQLSRVGGLKGVYIDFQNLHICYTFVRVWTSHQKVFQNLTINRRANVVQLCNFEPFKADIYVLHCQRLLMNS